MGLATDHVTTLSAALMWRSLLRLPLWKFAPLRCRFCESVEGERAKENQE